MKVVGLLSGGKDSCYNLVQCVAAGHEVTCLANLAPAEADCVEADSHMYQTVGWDSVGAIARAMELPLYVERVQGSSLSVKRDYEPCEGDEVEDLTRLLTRVRDEAGVEAVSVGAILSDYQRVRVESVCLRLGLTPLAFLWQRDQTELLREMISAGMESVLIKVACLGLDKRHLGKSLAEVRDEMERLSDKFGVNVCGEGGEYETFTLDMPLFRHKLRIAQSEVIAHSEDAFAPVYLLKIDCDLEEKPGFSLLTHSEMIRRAMVDDRELPEIISPLAFCEPFSSMTNHLQMEDNIPIEKLNLSKMEQKFTAEEGDWFTTVTMGRCKDDQGCVTEAFESLEKMLSEQSASLKDIVKIGMYVDSMDSYAAMNQEYVRHWGLNPPVRVCVAVDSSRLPPDARLVLECRGQRRPASGDPGVRCVLHVQGLSHWAPANIGPYSQGIVQSGKVLIAGSIGLVPGSMVLVSDSEAAQAGLALRHVARVTEVVTNRRVSLASATRVTCYVTSQEAARQAQHVWLSHEETDKGLRVRYVMVSQLPRGAKVEWEVELETVIDNQDD